MSEPVPILSEVIRRLREEAAGFSRRVGGTAAFAALANEQPDVALPYAFVVPVADTAGPRPNAGGAQLVEERFAVIICVDNKPGREDGIGLVASDALRALRQEVFDALLNWSPVPNMDDPVYVGSKHLVMTRSRLWHQYDFQIRYYINGTVPEPDNMVVAAFGRTNVDGAVDLTDPLDAVL